MYRPGQPNWEFLTLASQQFGKSAICLLLWFLREINLGWFQSLKNWHLQFWRLWILIFRKISHLEMSKVLKNSKFRAALTVKKCQCLGLQNDLNWFHIKTEWQKNSESTYIFSQFYRAYDVFWWFSNRPQKVGNVAPPLSLSSPIFICSLQGSKGWNGWPFRTSIQFNIKPRSINMRYLGDSAHRNTMGLQNEAWGLLGQLISTSTCFRTSKKRIFLNLWFFSLL